MGAVLSLLATGLILWHFWGFPASLLSSPSSVTQRTFKKSNYCHIATSPQLST
jgi:hypothetical protein